MPSLFKESINLNLNRPAKRYLFFPRQENVKICLFYLKKQTNILHHEVTVLEHIETYRQKEIKPEQETLLPSPLVSSK